MITLHRPIALFVLGTCLSSPLACLAAPATQEPPACADPDSVKGVRKQYNGLAELSGAAKAKQVVDAKQIHFGPAAPGVNQYATKTTYGTTSRYCEGNAVLDGGKTVPVLWRMDYLVEGKGFSINFDHCAAGHDLLDTGCKKMRAAK